MGKINVLSFAVANLIAAGEVVDRPSSVIKELLENAIDSGADRISVEIQNGGVTYMRVSDNGCGMTPEDLPISIRRHATSKIREAEDLEKIMTLGFRGEALAAIASVSDLRIISKPKNAEVGAMLEAHGGEIVGVTERACSDGTTVIVENLFANVPARRKFLKKDVTESMAVGALVEKIALSRPDIGFRLIVDGNMRLETVGDGVLRNAIYSIFGRDFSTRLIETEMEMDGIRVQGFIGRSDNVRANRNYQNFFINGRYVKSKTAGAALEQAYRSYIPPEKFPCCILFLTIHPAAVDVNVHPAKLEVKFSNERPVFEAIYYAVRNALESNQSRPEMTLAPQRKPAGFETRLSESTVPIPDGREESLKKRQITIPLHEMEKKVPESYAAQPKPNGFQRMSAADYVQMSKGLKEPIPTEQKAPPVSRENLKEIASTEAIPSDIQIQAEAIPQKTSPSPVTEQAPVRREPAVAPREEPPVPLRPYRIIGEAFYCYVLVETEEKLLVIDKHAAHERILFERLKAKMKAQSKSSQLLMIPMDVMMTSDEIQTLVEFKDEIEAIGFAFTTGKYTASVTEIPEGMSSEDVADMLAVIADRLKTNTGSAMLTRDMVFEKALYQASCKAAIKAGREYSDEQIQWLVGEMMKLPDITVCPHGRPVAMELTKKNIDRQFERS